jgi:hypothetical protein
MKPLIMLVGMFIMTALSCAASPQQVSQTEMPPIARSEQPGPGTLGRYQLVVVPNHPANPFLIDTMTGCLWHLLPQSDSKRASFVEADVENLHWSWGSGSQQVLANRIDTSNLTEPQKHTMKESIQKTSCGNTSVMLTPAAGASRTSGSGQAPTSGSSTPEQGR